MQDQKTRELRDNFRKNYKDLSKDTIYEFVEQLFSLMLAQQESFKIYTCAYESITENKIKCLTTKVETLNKELTPEQNMIQ